MKIAIIPARGGSKRIPKKNIKFFSGKPVIAYSIEAAKNSKLFDKIIVSTDDNKIAKISVKYGAEVPFIRPKNISDDHSTTTDVVKHCINYFNINKVKFRYVCCIYPVAPFISHIDIIDGFKKINRNKWMFVFSAVQSTFPIYRSFNQQKNKSINMNFPKFYSKRTQDLKKNYFDAGQFYWGTNKAWLKYTNLFKSYSSIIEIPNWRAVDVDTKEDWKNAEFINKNLNNINEK